MFDQADKLRQVIDNLKSKQAEGQETMANKTARKSARVFTITSGKGGVGKTNVTVNLAVALGELGYRVIILDADFGLANIDVLLGIVPKYNLLDVIQNRKNITEILSDGPKNVRFLSGGSGMEELIRLERPQLQRFLNNLELLDKIADIILIDTGAGLSDNVISMVMAADEVLVVTTPDPTSMTDAYALIKIISNRDRMKKIKIIVNRAENAEEANSILNKLVLVSNKFLNVKVEYGGYILYDEAVVRSVKQQRPFTLEFPRSQAAKSIRQITDNVFKYNESAAPAENYGVSSFINRFINLMRH